jgi:hypothetical protein
VDSFRQMSLSWMANVSSGSPSGRARSISWDQSMRVFASHCLSLPFWYSASSRARPSSYSQVKRATPAAGTSQVPCSAGVA